MSAAMTDVVRRVEQVMGMPISLALRGRQAASPSGAAAWEAVLTSLRWTDHVFSTWREESVISRLGRGEITQAECPPEVAEVLAIGESARVSTNGAFNVRRVVGGRSVLDPSGVVKGWAVDRASKVLRDLDDTDFCLAAGGDMICSAVSDRPEWRIGIEDPVDVSRVLAVVPVRDGAVATSGAAHRGDHVRHAITGRAPVGVAAVTVVHHSLTIADVGATCAYLQGAGAADWLRENGRTGVVVAPGGSSEVVDGGRSAQRQWGSRRGFTEGVTMKVDFKKSLDSYRGKHRQFRILDVPAMAYLMVDGHGDPNTATEYAEALGALYPVAYTIKFASKQDLGRDYVVPPLEALWWAADMEFFTGARDKSQWEWTAMLMVPDWIPREMFVAAVAKVAGKGPLLSLDKVRFETLEEGRCVQTLHIGSYDDEAGVLAELHDSFVPDAGLQMTGKHHEIYLSDPRRVEAAKLRTILRQPVRDVGSAVASADHGGVVDPDGARTV